jgi:hypothetical protein
MKTVFGLIFLSLTANISLGQKSLTQVNYTHDPNSSCGHVTLGSGFEKSGMVQYVARPRIIELRWMDGQLTIKIFVVSVCCPPDYLGYMVHSDTLKLYYGDKKSIPDKYGRPKEVDICMCGHNGCCYEFEYKINGLEKEKNYLVAVSDVLSIGSIEPYPIGYTDSRYKSVHYLMKCSSFEECLDVKIDDAISHYKRLGPLYDSLIDLHKNGGPAERKMVDNIKDVWIKYFDCRDAIYDKFIKSNVNHKMYSLKVDEFESYVSKEVKLLEPRLDIVNKYLQSGALAEPIQEIKSNEKKGG